jgi:hypothetical protein
MKRSTQYLPRAIAFAVASLCCASDVVMARSGGDDLTGINAAGIVGTFTSGGSIDNTNPFLHWRMCPA